MVQGQSGIVSRLRASDGRIRIATLAGVSALVVALALLGVMPAFAGAGDQLGASVPPTQITYGGGSGACDASFPGLPSDGAHELWINNPTSGTFPGPDGTRVKISVYSTDVDGVDHGADTLFSFQFLDTPNPNMAAFDVIVNGGSQNTHYDYDDGATGPVTSDVDLHAPTKGGSSNLYKLSHINICYGTFIPNVEGYKFHDRDTDGVFDNTDGKEEGLSGWTIAAFAPDGTSVRHTTTGADGSYVLGNLPALTGGGMYTICEATNGSGLPENETTDPWTWTWVQSAPANTLCTDLLGTGAGYEPGGYEVSGGASLSTAIDFGNHLNVAIDCSGDDPVSVSLGGTGIDDTPRATLIVPGNCPSLNGEFVTFFDVGLSEDSEHWAQSVVVSGDASSDFEIDLVIEWDAELRNPLTEPLVVPNTKVVFDGSPTSPPGNDVVLCGTDYPDDTISTCLYSRSIAEGATDPLSTDVGDIIPSGYIQVTDHLRFRGDPKSFR